MYNKTILTVRIDVKLIVNVNVKFPLNFLLTITVNMIIWMPKIKLSNDRNKPF